MSRLLPWLLRRHLPWLWLLSSNLLLYLLALGVHEVRQPDDLELHIIGGLLGLLLPHLLHYVLLHPAALSIKLVLHGLSPLLDLPLFHHLRLPFVHSFPIVFFFLALEFLDNGLPLSILLSLSLKDLALHVDLCLSLLQRFGCWDIQRLCSHHLRSLLGGRELDLHILNLLRWCFLDQHHLLLLVLLPHGLNHQLALSLVESVLLVKDCVRELILEFVI